MLPQVRGDGQVHDGGVVPVAVPGRGGARAAPLRVRVLPQPPAVRRRRRAPPRQVRLAPPARRRGTRTYIFNVAGTRTCTSW